MSSAAGLTPNGGAVHLATLLLLDFCSLASFAELGFVCGKYRNRPYAILFQPADGRPEVSTTAGRSTAAMSINGTGELAREGAALGEKLVVAARILAKKQGGLTGPVAVPHVCAIGGGRGCAR